MHTCKDKENCGGCKFQGVPYEEQLEIKQKQVLDLIEAKALKIEDTQPIEPAPSQFRYRNKMEYTFGDLTLDGEMTLGMHQKNRFMSIITVDECQLVHEDFNTILKATLKFCQEKGYIKYHKKRHKGLLRHLLIRRGERT
ncbi:MAG: 23S rRNA (uracil(1939)-C(5))-methyltransferase RlmD, partial [Anaerovoracaceae bacterium]